MTEQTILEPTTDIVLAVEQNPQIVLLDGEQYSAFFQRVKAETETLVPDTSTAKGRDDIRAMAAKVVKTKTAIDKARLALTSQWREQTSQVNAAGKRIESELEALADHVREPLTEWENAEKVRKNTCDDTINRIALAGIVTLEDTAATVRERGKEIWNIEIDEAYFQSQYEAAIKAKTHNIEMLKIALARLTKEEADKAELEQLRAAQAEREERDRIEREAREAKEAAEALARAEEERRIAAEQADAERVARIQREAEQRARDAAEQEAQAERDRVQIAHEQALAAERERAAEVERAAQRELEAERNRVLTLQFEAEKERLRLEREEQARLSEAARIAEETAKREANQAHRTRVKSAAKAALITCGADEETAKKIVLAIQAGEIPHVRLEF